MGSIELVGLGLALAEGAEWEVAEWEVAGMGLPQRGNSKGCDTVLALTSGCLVCRYPSRRHSHCSSRSI